MTFHRPINQVLNELQTYPETWSGMELTPVIAYGFRLYRNNTSLRMHVDKSHTHIISFILHVDSSEDSEPWPITIEDLDGSKFMFRDRIDPNLPSPNIDY